MKENIVFFFSDQQRYDTLGCNGQSLDVTPNLDRFARESLNFASCYTPQPVCGPARSVLQSGLYATQTGCFTNRIPLPLGINSLALHMRNAGYNVAYVGKWHLASDKGHNDYRTIAVPPERRGGYNGYWMAADMLEFTSHGYGGYVYDRDGNKIEWDGYRCDAVTEFALRFIEDYSEEKPFFLMLSHIEPHHQNDHKCYEGPKGSREKFAGFTVPDDLKGKPGDWAEQYPDYLGCCHSLDENFGRVIDALKTKGIYDDTMVIYSSDHGNHFRSLASEISPNGGTDDYKRNSFENTVHIPLLIKGRLFPRGERSSRLASLLDLPKTIMTAGGCEIEPEIQGRALQEISGAKDWREELYIQISECYTGRAVRTDSYKYVIHAPECDPWKDMTTAIWREKYLFDLKADPLERNNLLRDPSYAGIKEDMKRRMLRCAREAGENFTEILP
jgi:uncharacterized sulfatase